MGIPFIEVGEDQITPVISLRNNCVVFVCPILKMDMQIAKVCQNAFYHLHNIRRIRKFLNQIATCTIIHAFITRQNDCCKGLMNGPPENLIKKLQRVQNTAAKLVFNLRKCDHIIHTLVTHHWLPVKNRIEFKTLLTVFKGLHARDQATCKKWSPHPKAEDIPWDPMKEVSGVRVPKSKHDKHGKSALVVLGPLA